MWRWGRSAPCRWGVKATALCSQDSVTQILWTPAPGFPDTPESCFQACASQPLWPQRLPWTVPPLVQMWLERSAGEAHPCMCACGAIHLPISPLAPPSALGKEAKGSVNRPAVLMSHLHGCVHVKPGLGAIGSMG